jgi:hypothetical protein
VEVKKKKRYEVKISNRFEFLETLYVWMSVGLGKVYGNMKASATQSLDDYELKQHKPLFDEECSKLLDQRKWGKLQWLQNPSQTSEDNLNNVRCKTSRTFMNERREYQNDKISEL